MQSLGNCWECSLQIIYLYRIYMQGDNGFRMDGLPDVDRYISQDLSKKMRRTDVGFDRGCGD